MSHSPSQDGAHLTALTAMISDAVKVVISAHAAIGERPPSLDSTAPGPFDSPESVPEDLAKAIQIIEAACAQLSFSVASPGHTMLNVRTPRWI